MSIFSIHTVQTSTATTTEIANFGTYSSEGWGMRAVVVGQRASNVDHILAVRMAVYYDSAGVTSGSAFTAVSTSIESQGDGEGPGENYTTTFALNGSNEMVLQVTGHTDTVDWSAMVWRVQAS